MFYKEELEMNLILNILRRITLGGTVLLILSLVLKGGLPSGDLGIFFLICPLLYLLFVFFTWLSAKHSTAHISELTGMDIPSNNYFVTLFRGLAIDIVSPIGTIIDLFKDSSTKIVALITTYIIILAYAVIWFFVL